MKNILFTLLFIIGIWGLSAEILVSNSFDDTDFPPAGWTRNVVSGFQNWERTTTGYQPPITPHSGAAVATYRSYSASGGNGANLITHQFSAIQGYNYTVSFWMYRNAGYPTHEDKIRIYTNSIITTGDALIATIHRSIELAPVVPSNGWYFYSFEFIPVAVNDLSYIIINSFCDDGADMYIDDFVVSREIGTFPPQPAVVVSPANNATNMLVSTSLNWASGGGSPTDYYVYFGIVNPPPFVSYQTETTYSPTLNLGTTYYWQIVPHNLYGDAINCPIWTFSTGVHAICMTNGSQVIPEGATYLFFDSGGPLGNYQISEHYTFKFISANPAAALQFNFTNFNVATTDNLKIYNGPNILSSQIGPVNGYTGNYIVPGLFTGSNIVTFVFTSDSIENNVGWVATVNPVIVGTLNISGTVFGNDEPTVGLSEAIIKLTGPMYYTGTTNDDGTFNIAGIKSNSTYHYTIEKTGYLTASGSITISDSDIQMEPFILAELAYPPMGVNAVATYPNIHITWNAPNPHAPCISEGFESTTFPPTGWSQIINNTTFEIDGLYGTWSRIGAAPFIPPIAPREGLWQLAIGISWSHQNEWIMTPQFFCPVGASLKFNGLFFFIYNNLNTYNIKVSTDNGTNWTTIWTTLLSEGPSYASDYNVPFVISLADYAGQNIKLAWQAISPPEVGLLQEALIDNIIIDSPSRTISFSENDMIISSDSKDRSERSFLGYKIWRLHEGQETNEAAWTLLTTETFPNPDYYDNTWSDIPNGNYKWAVKAFYSGGLISSPAINPVALQYPTPPGTLLGNVRKANNVAIQGATITTGIYSATSGANGAYQILLPPGNYTVTCTKDGYVTAIHDSVNLVTGSTTNHDFILVPTVDNEDQAIVPVAATTLGRCYPNPFKLDTSFNYAVKGYLPVVIEIFNTKGQRIKTLVNEAKAQGNYYIKWDGTDLNKQKVTSGVYMCKMQAGIYTATKKMILMK